MGGREGPGGRQIAAAQTYLFTTHDSFGNRKCAAFRDISSETCVIAMWFGGWPPCGAPSSPPHFIHRRSRIDGMYHDEWDHYTAGGGSGGGGGDDRMYFLNDKIRP